MQGNRDLDTYVQRKKENKTFVDIGGKCKTNYIMAWRTKLPERRREEPEVYGNEIEDIFAATQTEDAG